MVRFWPFEVPYKVLKSIILVAVVRSEKIEDKEMKLAFGRTGKAERGGSVQTRARSVMS